jgi:hypothetical protein
MIEVGPNVALMPVPLNGVKSTLRFTAPLKPPSGVLDTVQTGLSPKMAACTGGETERTKGAAATTTLTVSLWLSAPLVPVMVIGYAPGPSDEATVTVKVEEVGPLIEVGLKLAVMPAGALALRATFPLNPAIAWLDTEYVALWPALIVRDAGAPDSTKVGGLTIRVTVVLWFRVLLIPVTVKV